MNFFKFNLSLTLILGLVVHFSYSQEDCPNYVPNCNPIDSTLICEVDNFSQLNFTNISSDCNYLIYAFKSKSKIIFSEPLDLKGIPNASERTKIQLLNIGGIDFGKIIIKNKPDEIQQLEIIDSNVKFYFNDMHVDNILACESIKDPGEPNNIFNMFDSIKLINIVFDNSICPRVFLTQKGTKKLILENVKGVNGNFFMKIKNTNLLTPRIEFLLISVSKGIYIDESFLSPVVFANLDELRIEDSYIDSIMPNSFSGLTNLRLIHLKIYNFPELISKSTNEWLSSLNPAANNELVLNIDTKYTGDYFYKDDDLCWYKYFPANRSVYMKIDKTRLQYCSCTLYWLVQNIDSNSNATLLNTTAIQDCFSRNFTQAISECSFEERLDKCQLPSPSPSKVEKESSSNTAFIVVICILSVFVVLELAYVSIIVYKKYIRRG
jgi:hypothetical protein